MARVTRVDVGEPKLRLCCDTCGTRSLHPTLCPEGWPCGVGGCEGRRRAPKEDTDERA